jgi:formylglycine-generating enzyme required for sulfatase activity
VVAIPAPPPPPPWSFRQATVQQPMPTSTIAEPAKIQLPPPPPPRVLQPPPLQPQSRSGLLVTVVVVATLLFAGAGVLIWKTQDNQAKRVIEAEAQAKQQQQARADAEAKEAQARQELAQQEEAAKKAASVAEEQKKQELQKELAMAQAKAEAKRKQADEAEAAKRVALRNSYSKDNCFRNTLGMEFVPIPNTRLLVCNTETRVQDYEVFVNKTKRKPSEIFTGFDMKEYKPVLSGGNWKDLGLTQTAGHPVAGVNWYDARDFCLWLTETEAPHKYRLLTVNEWMAAAGSRAFVYGNEFPPAADSGNFCGKEFIKFAKEKIEFLLETDDFFPFTSPVKSFKPNELGVYDMGGNLWEWCQDNYSASMNPDPTMKNEFAQPGVPYKVTKGGSWFNYQEKLLRNDFCNRDDPNKASVFVGFRIVLDWDSL